MLDPKIGLLANLPTFQGLSKKQLGLIVDIATKSYFEADDTLIVKDEPGDAAYLIMTGAAKCIDFPGKPYASEHIAPGAMIGEMAMLVETIHTVTVQATERLRAMTIRREALRRAMETDPVIAQRISDNLLLRLQSFARELRRFDQWVSEAEKSESERVSAPPIAFKPAIKDHARLPRTSQLPAGKTRRLG